MLGYVMIGTNDLERSGKFYDALLSEFGATRNMEEDNFILWNKGDGSTSLSVTKPYNGAPATIGNGVMVALYAPDQATVDKIHALAIDLGGTCDGPVGLRPEYGPDFYVGYFRDLDGNKLNIFHFPMP